MKRFKLIIIFFVAALAVSCGNGKKHNGPVVGFIDAFEDATIAQAREGFIAALRDSGYSEDKKNITIEYRNAQSDIPRLTQIANYFVSEKVDLLATSTTLSTVTALQKTNSIPVFAMVSPVPARMNVLDGKGKAPANLFGALEDLNYIDTSFSLIPKLLHPAHKLRIGMIYNQAEPQSADAMQRIKGLAAKLNVDLVALPVNTSSEAQLVTQSLLTKNIDAFFANPDNTVFAAFAVIQKTCDDKHVPIFTSEAGLVQRGAVAAFGADIFQWGYQAGMQAVHYLKTGKTDGIKWEMVKVRKRVYNAAVAKKYNIVLPSNFQAIK